MGGDVRPRLLDQPTLYFSTCVLGIGRGNRTSLRRNGTSRWSDHAGSCSRTRETSTNERIGAWARGTGKLFDALTADGTGEGVAVGGGEVVEGEVEGGAEAKTVAADVSEGDEDDAGIVGEGAQGDESGGVDADDGTGSGFAKAGGVEAVAEVDGGAIDAGLSGDGAFGEGDGEAAGGAVERS